MKVIFLDLDGVLVNDHSFDLPTAPFDLGFHIPFRDGFSQFDPACVARLNKIIELTQAKIVISSSWRILCYDDDNQFNKLIGYMKSQGINGEIIDKTPLYYVMPFFDGPIYRGDEIQEWLNNTEEDVEKFVIIDDIDDMGKLSDLLVHTDGRFGLRDNDVEKAIEILHG